MKMNYTSQQWHNRFLQQAAWTHDLRHYLYERTGLAKAQRILDIGCGTGVLEAEITSLSQAGLVGADINVSHLRVAQQNSPSTEWILADGQILPMSKNTFDFSLCHFLLLWVSEPLQVLHEMARVTRPGGAVLILAEPDFGGRIDFPNEFTQLGTWQQASLLDQGADPLIGRRLAALLHQAGLTQIETGVIGGHWNESIDQTEWEAEWDMLVMDLARLGPDAVDPIQLKAFKEKDARALEAGERVLFVPTFYGWGIVV